MDDRVSARDLARVPRSAIRMWHSLSYRAPVGSRRLPSLRRCRYGGLDAESAIIAGGWDARYAVTLAVATQGDIAAALIDTNGDGADIDLDEYERGADGHWRELISGNVDERGAHWSSRIASTWGQADPVPTLRSSTSTIAIRS